MAAATCCLKEAAHAAHSPSPQSLLHSFMVMVAQLLLGARSFVGRILFCHCLTVGSLLRPPPPSLRW